MVVGFLKKIGCGNDGDDVEELGMYMGDHKAGGKRPLHKNSIGV